MLYVGVLCMLYVSKRAKRADFSTIGIFVKFLMKLNPHPNVLPVIEISAPFPFFIMTPHTGISWTTPP